MRKKSWINLFLAGVVVLILLLVEILDNNSQWFVPEATPEPVVTEQALGETAADMEDCEVFFTNPKNILIDVRDPETGILELINGAQKTIDMTAFEFDLASMKDALSKAWYRGVTIRVVYDDEYTDEGRGMSELLSLGIKGVPDERSGKMHDKFLVVDGKTVWTGSFNFSENAAHRNNENAMRIESAALARIYTEEFERMFAGNFGPRKEDESYPPLNICSSVGRVYFSPLGPKEAILDVLDDSQESIHVMALSFTDDDMAKALIQKSKSGLEVGAIVETRGSDSQGGEIENIGLSATGCTDSSTTATFHHKVMIVDGEIIIFGSYNFSASAEEDNDENLLIIESPAIAQKFEEEYQRRLTEVMNSGFCTVN